MSSNDTPGHDRQWIKARRSSNGSECVQMRRHGDVVQVRDSKNPDGAVLSFTPEQFTAWITAAREHQSRHGD